MATELPPPDDLAETPTAPVPEAVAVASGPSLSDNPTATTKLPKRQRRPSVRLGEIGGEPSYDSHVRRPNRTWRFHKHPSFAAKTSKTRPLTNLVNDDGAGDDDSNFQDSLEPADGFIYRKPKNKRPIKRPRTNWSNKFESAAINSGSGEAGGGGGGVIEITNDNREDNLNDDEEFRELENEGFDSPLLKEQQSPTNSAENMDGLQFWGQQRKVRVRGNESNGVLHNEVNSSENRNEENLGIKEWLDSLGLRKYAPVFDIHEVDDEVLPLLTLEDLKDMGINAVGSRRKMHSAILKLRKGFS